MKLARKEYEHNGRHATLYEGDLFYDDGLAALRMTEMLNDSEAVSERAYLMQQIMMCEPGEITYEVISKCTAAAWDLYGIDLDGSHDSECGGKRVIDWEQDAEYIKVSLLNAYGLTWAQASTKISYMDLASIIGLVPRETPMGQAIYYRTAKPPQETKQNREYVKEFRKRQRFWRLDAKESTMRSANAEASSMFESFAKMAQTRS